MDRCVHIQLCKWDVVAAVAVVAVEGASAGRSCRRVGGCVPCFVGIPRVEGPTLLCALVRAARGSGWGGARDGTVSAVRRNDGRCGKAGARREAVRNGDRSHRRPGVGGMQKQQGEHKQKCKVCVCNQLAPEGEGEEGEEGDMRRGLLLCERVDRTDGELGLAGERGVGSSPWEGHRDIHSVCGHHCRID